MVSRIMSWTSVWPMVSDSMTKPRERKRLMTRLNVNGLLSIVATSVCFKGDHLRECRPGHHHGEHVFRWVDEEFDEGRSRLVHRPLDGLRHARGVLDLAGRNAVRVRQLEEVHRVGQVDLDVVPLVEELLPLPDHAQVVVVEEGDLEVEAVLLHNRQLLAGHLEAAVSGAAPDRFVWPRVLHADG